MTEAWQDSVEDLPEDTLLFLLGSRYCETDLLSANGLATLRRHGSRVSARAGHLRLRP